MFQAFGNPCLLSMHDVNVLESAGSCGAWLWQLPLLSTVEATRRNKPSL
jgi:hypothetical protein